MATGVARDLAARRARPGRDPQQERLLAWPSTAGPRSTRRRTGSSAAGPGRRGSRAASRTSCGSRTRRCTISSGRTRPTSRSTRRRRASAAGPGGSTWPSRTATSSCWPTSGAISPGFDPNDTGFQYGGVGRHQHAVPAGLPVDEAGQDLPHALVVGGWFRNYDFGGNKIWDGGLVSFQGQLRNFWSSTSMFAYNPDTVSKSLTRGGPLALVAVGIPGRPERRDGQPQAGRVRVRGDDLPEAAGGGGVERAALGALEAGVELQPVDRADARLRAERHPVGDDRSTTRS